MAIKGYNPAVEAKGFTSAQVDKVRSQTKRNDWVISSTSVAGQKYANKPQALQQVPHALRKRLLLTSVTGTFNRKSKAGSNLLRCINGYSGDIKRCMLSNCSSLAFSDENICRSIIDHEAVTLFPVSATCHI